MTCIIFTLFVFATFSTSSAIAPFVPHDKEFVYDYAAIIRSATDLPDRFSSEFYLFAKLRIQSPTDTSLLVQLTNITFKLYNGKRKVGYKKEFSKLPLVSDSADIMQPFEIRLNSNGQAESISVEKSEKLYVRNMHKAVTALLQLKVDDLNFTSIKPDTFITQEHSIYGKGRTVYTIIPKDEELIIKKMRESVSTKRMYQLETTNFEGDVCESPYEEPLAHSSHQHYILKNTSGNYIVKSIESKGGLYFYPFRAKSDAHFIHSSISLTFCSITSIKSPIKIHTKKHEKDLTFDIFEPSLQVDESFYNTLENNKTMISTLGTIFDEIFLYLQKNHMNTNDIDVRKAHLSTLAIRLLRTCNLEKLNRVYNDLCFDGSQNGQKYLKLFHELIPFVGTHASVLLVKKIIYDKKVDDTVAFDMIQSVSSYVRFPTEVLLRDTEDMLNWGNEINKNVRKTAALAFGTLIHKTFKSELALATREREDKDSRTFHQHGSHAFSQESKEINRFLKEHKIYKQYMDLLINKLESSTDVESGLLYLQVIFNTKLPLAIPYLIPIVTGENPKNHDLHEMAMWSLSHMLLGDPDLIVKLYWPILTDRHIHTELRIAAYYIIIKSRPSLTGMLNIHYVLQDEPSPELYNMHYSYLQAMSQSDDPCNQVSRLNAAQILKFTQKPNHQAMSRYYQVNFNDKKYGHGIEVNGVYITAARTRSFVADISLQMFNKKTNYYLLFFKIGGLPKHLSRSVEFNLLNSFGLLNYRDLLETIMSIEDMKHFHIQISISNNYHTLQLYYFTKANLHEFYDTWKKLLNDKFIFNQKRLNFNYEDATEVIFPTEMGMPASLEMLMPTMTYQHLNIETKTDNHITTFLIDSKLKGLRSISWGLDFYNPIVSVYQGIKRYHSYDSVLPLFIEVTVNQEQQTLSVSWKTHPEKTANVFGIRSYATNFVYVEDYVNDNLLQSSCAKCKNWVQVTKGDPYRFNYTVLHDEGLTSGIALKGLIFDAERDANTDSLNILIQGSNHNEKKTRLEDILTFVRNFHFSDIFQPSSGTQGFLIAAHPIVPQIDVTFGFKETLTQEKNEYLPAIKFNPHLKYQVKNNNDTVLKELDVDAVIETNSGHTLQTIEVEVVSTGHNINSQKICFTSIKTWDDECIKGNISLSAAKTLTDECENVLVDVVVKGEQLEEQKTPFHVYEVCDIHSHNFKPDYHSMRCLAEHTSIRKYVYDINTYQISPEYNNVVKDLFFFFIDKHEAYHNFYASNENNQVRNNFKIIVHYLNENEANIEIITPEGIHELTTIPTSSLFWFGLRPDNTHFSAFFLWMNYVGMVYTCAVKVDEIQYEFNEEKRVKKFVVNENWTMIIGNSDVEPQQAVFLRKHGHDELSLKLVYKNQSLEICPSDDEGEQFTITLNGQELSQVMDHYKEDWFSYVIRPYLKKVIITIFHFQQHLEYSSKQLVVQFPTVSSIPLSGPCTTRKF